MVTSPEEYTPDLLAPNGAAISLPVLPIRALGIDLGTNPLWLSLDGGCVKRMPFELYREPQKHRKGGE